MKKVGKTNLFFKKMYEGNLGILSRDRKTIIRPNVCKEVFLRNFNHAVAWDGKVRFRNMTYKASTSRPVIVIECNLRRKKESAQRILDVLNLVSTKMKVKFPPSVRVSNNEKCGSIFIRVDNILLHSAVSVHTTLTFIRSAMKFHNARLDSIKHFVADVIAHDGYNDGQHFRYGQNNGNLDKFLNKKLKCNKVKEKFGGFKIAWTQKVGFSTDYKSGPYVNGICNHSEQNVTLQPLVLKDLKMRFG